MKTTARATKRPEGVRKPESAMKGTHATKSQLAISEPLEVMLAAMREHWAQGEWDRAAAIAKLAAPYVHPRLSSIEQKPAPIDVTKLTDEELETLRRIYQRAERVSDAD
jgi:hypothetical protein